MECIYIFVACPIYFVFILFRFKMLILYIVLKALIISKLYLPGKSKIVDLEIYDI
jgi:hypothetical protein